MVQGGYNDIHELWWQKRLSTNTTFRLIRKHFKLYHLQEKYGHFIFDVYNG